MVRRRKSMSRRKYSKKRQSRRIKRRTKRRTRRKSRKSRRRTRRRSRLFMFGSPNMPDLSVIMGNYPGAAATATVPSTFQQYTGMSVPQFTSHTSAIPKNLQSNFYSNKI